LAVVVALDLVLMVLQELQVAVVVKVQEALLLEDLELLDKAIMVVVIVDLLEAPTLQGVVVALVQLEVMQHQTVKVVMADQEQLLLLQVLA
jgi:hypothetical protein